jgi:outer membrane beta-barrel protein
MLPTALVLALGLALVTPSAVYADDGPRPMIQPRFAIKQGTAHLHLTGTTQVRNDFYDSFGGGFDLGYYWHENWGGELRLVMLHTTLSQAARNVQSQTGLSPDARAQDFMTLSGIRYSFGYGKIQSFNRFIVHFDPQFTLYGGTAFAQGRIIPTMTTGLSLLSHFRYGLQLKIDLSMVAQLERRDRGWVPSFGFSPFLGFGIARPVGRGAP